MKSALCHEATKVVIGLGAWWIPQACDCRGRLAWHMRCFVDSNRQFPRTPTADLIDMRMLLKPVALIEMKGDKLSVSSHIDHCLNARSLNIYISGMSNRWVSSDFSRDSRTRFFSQHGKLTPAGIYY